MCVYVLLCDFPVPSCLCAVNDIFLIKFYSCLAVVLFFCSDRVILRLCRHARGREEWESAALQNGNTKCNGLLPLWGPQVAESAYASCLARQVIISLLHAVTLC